LIKKYWHITIIILFLIFIAGVVYIIYPPFEKLKFGLDLSGGSQITLIPEDRVSEDFIKESFMIMKDRLSKLNLAEPRITMDESNRILVQLPKLENLDGVLNVIRNRGKLEFKIIEGVDIGLKYIEKEKEDEAEETDKAEKTEEKSEEPSKERIEISPEEITQTTTNILDKLKEIVGEENIEYERINDVEFNLRLKKIDIQRAYMAILQIIMQESAEKETFERIEITKYDPVYGDKVEIGEHLKDAEPRSAHSQYPQIRNSVILFLDKEIEKKFRDLIEQNTGESLSIVLDGVIKSISAIDDETIPPEEVSTLYIPQIETFEEAKNIATILQTGPMPVNFKIFENTDVGPTLGKDIIYKSLITIAVSFLLLLIFILIYYRGPGLFSDIGFIFFLIPLFSSMVLMKVILTTSSICGIFMSIALFLFSNIYILEKIKDELKIGRAMITSVDFGFKNSLNDVLYINAAVFIISTMLNYTGTMRIRILSFPLIMGSILTIVTLFTFTRSGLLLSSNLFQKFRLIPFFKRKSG
jgi:protein-export membrane protein SecD